MAWIRTEGDDIINLDFYKKFRLYSILYLDQDTDSYLCRGFRLVAEDDNQELETVGYFSEIDDVHDFLHLVLNHNFWNSCPDRLKDLLRGINGFPKDGLDFDAIDAFILSLKIKEEEVCF